MDGPNTGHFPPRRLPEFVQELCGIGAGGISGRQCHMSACWGSNPVGVTEQCVPERRSAPRPWTNDVRTTRAMAHLTELTRGTPKGLELEGPAMYSPCRMANVPVGGCLSRQQADVNPGADTCERSFGDPPQPALQWRAPHSEPVVVEPSETTASPRPLPAPFRFLTQLGHCARGGAQ